MTLLLNFLRNNWKPLAILFVLLSLGGYIYYINWDRERLDAKVEQITAEFQAYKDKAKQQADQFQKDAQLARNVSDEVLRQKEIVLTQEYEDKLARIKNDKGLVGITVPRSSVRLLNDTTRSATFTGIAPATSKETSSTKADPIALTVIFEVVAENNTNHLSCVNQVLEFQDFYNKLRGVANVNTP